HHDLRHRRARLRGAAELPRPAHEHRAHAQRGEPAPRLVQPRPRGRSRRSDLRLHHHRRRGGRGRARARHRHRLSPHAPLGRDRPGGPSEGLNVDASPLSIFLLLAVLSPLLGAAVSGLLLRSAPKTLVSIVSVSAVALSFAFAAVAYVGHGFAFGAEPADALRYEGYR